MRTYRQIILVTCVITITLALSIAPATASKTPPQGKNIIIVGGEIGYPPYSFLNEKGEPTGLSVELTRAIAKTMGINIEIRLTPWTEARNALENSTIDIIPGMFYSEERAKIFDFSPPFSIVSTAIFARIHSPSVESIEDTRDREIIVMRGEAMHDYILKHRLTDRILLTETPADALRLLASGKGDYALVAQMPGFYWIKELKLSNITSVGPSLEPFENCFAVRKGNNLLLSSFTEGLSIINQTGEYQQISEKWLGVLMPTRINTELMIKYAAIVIIPLILLLALSFLWSWMLRSRVNIKTKELLESEKKYRLMAENMSDVISVMDINFRFTYVSPSITRLTGFSVEEALQHSIEDIMTPDSYKEILKIMEEEITVEASGKNDPSRSRIIEYQQYTKDRSIVWVESNCRFLRDRDQKLGGILIISRDITERKQAEEALRKSEWYLRSTLDGLSAHITVLDDRGEIILTNKAYRDFGERNGINPRAVSEGTNYLAICDTASGGHSEEANPFAEGIRGVLSGRLRSFELEYPCHSPDEKRWFVGHVTPFVGEGPQRVIVTHEDITDRKQAEEALRESNKTAHQFFSESSAGAFFMMLDEPVEWKDSVDKEKVLDYVFEHQRITKINRAMLDQYLASEKDFLCMTPKRLFAHDLEHGRLLWRKMFDQGFLDIDSDERRYDGSQMWVVGSYSCMFDEQGKIIGHFGTQHDITELKKAEQNLSSTLSLLDAALESTEDGILVISSTGKITKMNQKFLELWQIPAEFAISSEDNTLLQYAVKQLADPEAFLTKVRDLYDTPADASFDEIEFSDGRVFERYSQPQWLDKQIVGRVWSFRDVTFRKHSELEQEKLQGQLTQAQKMESVGRLAGGVAHDFNNMLGVILGHTEFAIEKAEENHDLYADLKEIQKAAQRSADLTRQLLTFARKQIIDPKMLDLNHTVESMLSMLRRLIGEDIDLVWQPSTHLWPVKMDPSQIDQILANLCVNARDAIADVGKLTIETGRHTFDVEYCNEHAGFIPGDFVLLAVSDNGCGMDKKTLGNLFEPFFTTKEVGKGTGLGLATIYGIVKQNNGFINVYSEPGQGSTFKIYLPRCSAGDETPGVIQPEKPVPTGNETILLVEDEPAILNMTRMMLERKGYSVLPAATPAEAIDTANAHADKIHLIMTDVVMPEMNGRNLAEKMSALYPEIKLLFMSGYTANVIAHQGVLDEGVAFIQKPFSMADLAGKVREVLDKVSDETQA